MKEIVDKELIKKIQITPFDSLYEAIQRMNESALKILIVVDESKRVVGTLSDGDIRRSLLNGLSLNSSIRNSFNSKPKLIDEKHKNLSLEFMLQHDIDRLPVIDKNGHLLTILIHDLQSCFNSKIQSNLVIIMAGGKGRRLKPITDIIPKPLLPIHGKPIIHQIMDVFKKYGFNKFVFTLNYKKEMIKLYLDSISEELYDISLIEEEDFLGTAGALALIPKFDKPIFSSNCDILLDIDYRKALEYHEENNNEITIIGNLQEISVPYGILQQSSGNLIDIEEKPILHYNVNTGIYILNPSVAERVPKNQRIDMPDVIKNEKVIGSKIGIYPTHEKWFDIGNWADLHKNC